VTAEGHPYTRLRRALERENVVEAMSAASEIPVVGLDVALEILLLLARKEPARYERAALRWHSRYVHEHRVEDCREAEAVLVLLGMLTGPSAGPAARALAQFLHGRGVAQATTALIRWAG
jgi:hypothetical protein